MTLQKLYAEIAKREAKKSQVSIGNIREVLKHLFDIASESYENLELIEKAVRKRMKKS